MAETVANRYRVPFVNPREHYGRIKAEIDLAITDTLSRGDLVLRQQLRDFEEHLASYVGTKFAVGVASGYNALHFSLLAAKVGPGDEVITVGHTFVATVSAIIHAGATPVLVDVGTDYNIDVDLLEEAISPRTKALIPVHLNGRLCQMDRLMKVAERHELAVIEDAAQALGASFQGKRAGSFGATGCFSFYPFKVLGGFGDGGAVTTDSADVAGMVTLLRFNGEDRTTGEYHCHGYTGLLDNVQAAVLDVKLRYLDAWISHRRSVAEQYQEGLKGVPGLILPHFDETSHVDSFQNYVIRSKDRDGLRHHLRNCGIETLVHWPKPMWEHKGLGLKKVLLPETEAICREVLSLPMSAETTEGEVQYTARSVREFFERSDGARMAGEFGSLKQP